MLDEEDVMQVEAAVVFEVTKFGDCCMDDEESLIQASFDDIMQDMSYDEQLQQSKDNCVMDKDSLELLADLLDL